MRSPESEASRGARSSATPPCRAEPCRTVPVPPPCPIPRDPGEKGRRRRSSPPATPRAGEGAALPSTGAGRGEPRGAPELPERPAARSPGLGGGATAAPGGRPLLPAGPTSGRGRRGGRERGEKEPREGSSGRHMALPIRQPEPTPGSRRKAARRGHTCRRSTYPL